MRTPYQRIVVFNALVLRGLIINDRQQFPDEIQAFTIAFRGRRFRVLLTDGILNEYQANSPSFLPFELQPALDNLLRGRRAIYAEESQLQRFPIELTGLPQEHRPFILDAIAGNANYLITNRRRWLNLTEQAESRHGLSIVTPGRFIELEG